jgi:hypothetical protein
VSEKSLYSNFLVLSINVFFFFSLLWHVFVEIAASAGFPLQAGGTQHAANVAWTGADP